MHQLVCIRSNAVSSYVWKNGERGVYVAALVCHNRFDLPSRILFGCLGVDDIICACFKYYLNNGAGVIL